MNFQLCKSCQFFKQELKTEDCIRPKSCANRKLEKWFGEEVGGFP